MVRASRSGCIASSLLGRRDSQHRIGMCPPYGQAAWGHLVAAQFLCVTPARNKHHGRPEMGRGRQPRGPAMSKYVCKIDPAQIVAVDVHTHAETSARSPRDPCSMIFDEAMAKYFKEAGRPTIPQVAQYYRERKM